VEGCLAVCHAGLERLYSTFRYGDGTLQEALEERRVRAAFDDSNESSGRSRLLFRSGRVNGMVRGTPTTDGLVLPYRDKILRGGQVLQQMDKWASSGVIEPDTAAAIHNLTPTDVDLSPSNNSDWVFVVMGAGAAMGPLDTLLSMGRR